MDILPARRITGARAHDRRRQEGDSFSSASRHLANRYFGMLHHCLQTRQAYDDAKAFPASLPAAA